MDRMKGRGNGNVVNLEDFDDVGTVGDGTPINAESGKAGNPILHRGAPQVDSPTEEDDGDFTDLEDLKNLKIMSEEVVETGTDLNIDNLDEAINRQLSVMSSMREAYDELEEKESRVNGIVVIDDEDDDTDTLEEEDNLESDDEDDDDYADEGGVEIKRVPVNVPPTEEEEYDYSGIVSDEDEELENARRLKREEDAKLENSGVLVGRAAKTENTNTIKKGNKVQKKTQARIQGNLARLRNAANMAGAYHDTYLPKSNLVFRAYKPTNSIALDNRTIQGDWITAGRDRLRATLKEFYENGVLRCAENVSFEVFLRSISYRDLKFINCGIASTIVDKWEMDIGVCKHVDANDGPCTASKESESITLPIKDIVAKAYKAQELERLNRYDNTKTIAELQSETLFGQCEVYTIDIHNNAKEKTGTMNVYTSEASVERFLSVMRTVDDYLIGILTDERPDMRAIAGSLSTEDLLHQVKEIMPERAQEAYGVAIVMLGIDKIEVGTVGENSVVEFKIEDVRTYEELFELFTIIDSRIMAKLGEEDKQQEMMNIGTFKFKYKRKCGHVTTVSVVSELVLNLPRRALLV